MKAVCSESLVNYFHLSAAPGWLLVEKVNDKNNAYDIPEVCSYFGINLNSPNGATERTMLGFHCETRRRTKVNDMNPQIVSRSGSGQVHRRAGRITLELITAGEARSSMGGQELDVERRLIRGLTTCINKA
ncbi:hypothetical protein EVAR_89531_1 [Eumeta japonica]|uniref:Uncharacterized protein n=1 Tax=Eumeta variegata TaxID=151549 RepID=A0A4C1Y8E3_EUMVA|nr:hypothetical protein EVAR_89531_1 [Eumeta japonica]